MFLIKKINKYFFILYLFFRNGIPIYFLIIFFSHVIFIYKIWKEWPGTSLMIVFYLLILCVSGSNPVDGIVGTAVGDIRGHGVGRRLVYLIGYD